MTTWRTNGFLQILKPRLDLVPESEMCFQEKVTRVLGKTQVDGSWQNLLGLSAVALMPSERWWT